MKEKRPRVSVTDEGRAVVIHPRRWNAVFFVLAAIWNGFGLWWSRSADFPFSLMAGLGVLLFAYLAVRSFADVFVRFENGTMTVRAKPLVSIARPDFELPMVDIEAFVADHDDDHECEGHAVFVFLKGEGLRPKKRVPLPLAGIVLRSRGARTPFAGGVSYEAAAEVAEALNESLAAARRTTTGYRVMGGTLPMRFDSAEQQGEQAREDADVEEYSSSDDRRRMRR